MNACGMKQSGRSLPQQACCHPPTQSETGLAPKCTFSKSAIRLLVAGQWGYQLQTPFFNKKWGLSFKIPVGFYRTEAGPTEEPTALVPSHDLFSSLSPGSGSRACRWHLRAGLLKYFTQSPHPSSLLRVSTSPGSLPWASASQVHARGLPLHPSRPLLFYIGPFSAKLSWPLI